MKNENDTTCSGPEGCAAAPCSPLHWRTDFDEHDNTTWEANGPYTDEDGSCEFLFRITQRLKEDKHEFVEDSDAELMMDDEDPRVWTSLAEAQQAMAQDYADIVSDCASEANVQAHTREGAAANSNEGFTRAPVTAGAGFDEGKEVAP